MSDPLLRVAVSQDRWSGHGEGGVIARVAVIKSYGLYNSSDEDVRQAHDDAAYINRAIEAFEASGGK